VNISSESLFYVIEIEDNGYHYRTIYYRFNDDDDLFSLDLKKDFIFDELQYFDNDQILVIKNAFEKFPEKFL
jgi:hypothetical protein